MRSLGISSLTDSYQNGNDEFTIKHFPSDGPKQKFQSITPPFLGRF